MQDESGKQQKRSEGFWKRLERSHERKLRRVQLGQRGFLRPQIIELFEQQPMNGVDIMDRLQEMSHGWYRPSPGSIYPLLDQLEKEGLITKNKEGKFELTSAYSDLSGVGENMASALSSIESNASYLEDLLKSDPSRLSKSRDRIERLVERLNDLKEAADSEGTK